MVVGRSRRSHGEVVFLLVYYGFYCDRELGRRGEAE